MSLICPRIAYRSGIVSVDKDKLFLVPCQIAPNDLDQAVGRNLPGDCPSGATPVVGS
jgi:hypothetical protein